MAKNKTSQTNKPHKPTRDDFLEDIVNQLVKRRHALGLTQERLDQIMGNSDRLCSKWECGMRTPSGFNLYCWAEALSVRIQIEDF